MESKKRYVPSQQRQPLSMEQVRILWVKTRQSEAVIEEYDGPIRFWLYLLATMTGYRRRELGSLTPESFRLDGEFPEVAVPGQITKNGNSAYQPVPHYLKPSIRKWLASMKLGQLLFPKLEKLKTAKMMAKDLVEAGLAADEDKARSVMVFHGWRHLFITNCWTSGESANVVRELARHSDLKTTLGYSHTVERQRHDAVNRMNRLSLPEEDD